jgi:hypothetical protein
MPRPPVVSPAAVLQCFLKSHRAVLVGSVVRHDYDWDQYFSTEKGWDQSQIKPVVNYVATRDWVVATVPKFLQTIRWLDLGSGGHDGFEAAGRSVHEIRYVPGPHNAAILEQHWDEIAEFVLGGPAPRLTLPAGSPPEGMRASSQDRGVVRLGHWSWVVVPLTAAAVVSSGWSLLTPLGLPGPVIWPVNLPGYVWAFLFVVWCWVVTRILTRI